MSTRSSGAAQAAPLAAQLRQLDRETGPEEPRLLRKYAPLGYIRIRSEYGPAGLVQREVGRLRADNTMEWFPLHQVDLELEIHNRSVEAERLLARGQQRLGRLLTTLTGVNDADMRILRMSNKDFQSFRSSRGGSTSTQVEEESPENPATGEGQGEGPRLCRV